MTTSPSPRVKRQDAAANRERLLASAVDYLSLHGPEASLHGLAELVGFGIGTVYRHFPSRVDLLRAVYERMGEGVDEAIARAAHLPTGWDTVVAYIDIGTAVAFRYPGGGAILERMSQLEPELTHGVRWERPMIDAVARAQSEGSLRGDVSAADVAYVFQLLGGLARVAEPLRGLLYARQRALLLDGLRSADRQRDPMPLEPLTPEDLRGLARRGGV